MAAVANNERRQEREQIEARSCWRAEAELIRPLAIDLFCGFDDLALHFIKCASIGGFPLDPTVSGTA